MCAQHPRPGLSPLTAHIAPLVRATEPLLDPGLGLRTRLQLVGRADPTPDIARASDGVGPAESDWVLGHRVGPHESPHCPGEPELRVRLLTGWLQGGAGAVALLIGQEATGLCEVTGLPGRRARLWWRCCQLPLCWSWQRPQPPEITARVSKCRNTLAGGCFLQSRATWMGSVRAVERPCWALRSPWASQLLWPRPQLRPQSPWCPGCCGLVPDTPRVPSPCGGPTASRTSGPESQGPCPPSDGRAAADSGGPGAVPCSLRPSVHLRLPHVPRPGGVASACSCSCHGPRIRPAGFGPWHPAPLV